jgi:Cu-Zn family superoxide dismutase
MFIRNCVLAATLVWTTTVFAQSATQSAHADIVNAHGQKIGIATIHRADGGIRIDIQVSQLPLGSHGIHIHTAGKCEGPGFTSAGAHFNPTSKKHGKDNPEGPHAGDLLNIQVEASGDAKASLLDPNITLGDGPNSIFHEGGTAIVIHEKADDYKTDPAGNSGARIACGVIERSLAISLSIDPRRTATRSLALVAADYSGHSFTVSTAQRPLLLHLPV